MAAFTRATASVSPFGSKHGIPFSFPRVRSCSVAAGRLARAERRQCRGVAGGAQRGRGRRFLALSGGRYPVRQLGRHNCHLRTDHEIAETGVKIGIKGVKSEVAGRADIIVMNDIGMGRKTFNLELDAEGKESWGIDEILTKPVDLSALVVALGC